MFASLAAVVCGWIAPRYPDRAPAAGARRLRAGIVGLIFVGLLLPSPAAFAVAPPAANLEVALPNGRHFQQASEYQGLGFDIVDLPTTPVGAAPLWSAVRARGGPTLLGYPLSRAFVGRDQCVYQILQRVILQACGAGQVQFANTFELLEQAGKDEWLAAFHSVPPPITSDGSTSLQHAIEIRLGWLTNAALREAYLQPLNGEVAAWSQTDAINLYGLPMSRPVDYGPFVSQRFQRIALQWWKQWWNEAEQADILPGEVTPVLAGQLAVAAGLVADTVCRPHAPGTAVRMPLPVIESWPPALSREQPPTISPVPPAGYPDLPEGSVRMVDGQSQQSGGPRAYVVWPGDNGSVIYGVDMCMLQTNGLSADELINPGQKLRIPPVAGGLSQPGQALRVYVVWPGDNVSVIAQRHGVDT